MIKNFTLLLFLLLSIKSSLLAQITNDSIVKDSIVKDSLKFKFDNKLKFNYKQLIIPAVLIGYGTWATDNDQLELFNIEIREEVTEHIDNKITIDDFSQYAPLVSTFALDFAGIKSKNKLRDKTIISATATLMMAITVSVIKKTAQVERPDKSNFYSFPSGHTATSFMGAELLYQEYKDKSIWYGVSGYLVATGTGVFRMLNNRHWLSDVVTGAGIGILSAKAAYWLFPSINKLISKNKSSNNKTVFIPFYNGKITGFGLVSQF